MDGTTWVWGNDPYGYLGDGADLKRNIPILVAVDTGLSTAAKIAAGRQHSLAIDSTGQAWAWGANWDGQSGISWYYEIIMFNESFTRSSKDWSKSDLPDQNHKHGKRSSHKSETN